MRIVALMLIVAALSGCAGVDEYVAPEAAEPDQEPVQDTSEPELNDTEPEETVNETVENLVPELNVTLSAINGTAPLLVNITIDATDDSEVLSWIVLVDGNETHNGTDVPATVNHTFEAGNWSVVVQLSDGEHAVAQAFDLAVDLADPEPVLLHSDEYEGVLITAPHRGACLALAPTSQGCAWLPISNDLQGSWVQLSHIDDGNYVSNGWTLEIRAACDVESDALAEAGDGEWVEVSEGAGCALVYGRDGSTGATTIRLDYYSAPISFD